MAPSELSLAEIRKFMLDNGCRVTNHALVKYFKPFLTQPTTRIEARNQFKNYVNILATIKIENNEKYLVLRKKYLNECPTEEAVNVAENVPYSPGEFLPQSDNGSPFRAPPPYKPPPQVAMTKLCSPLATGVNVQQEQTDSYRDCVNEFAAAVRRLDPQRLDSEPDGDLQRVQCLEEQQLNNNKENIPRFSFSSGNSTVTNTSADSDDITVTAKRDVVDSVEQTEQDDNENPISVKEATRKFNRMASEEEAKIISPPSKKKPEKLIEEKDIPEVTLAHPKAKEWIVAMAKASYQELAKLASEHPELVKLQDPATSTALHWAAKHGNEDVIKLIAGTYKADVSARTNGGYTPLHLAMQFGRTNIFELLCNVYKANRDLTDWSGNKPLDYSKQRRTISALTYSKIKARRKNAVEKDLGFLRIGSLNVRVKKTTEAFSNFLGVGNGNGNAMQMPMNLPHRHHHHAHHHRHRAGMTNSRLHHHYYHHHPARIAGATTLPSTGTQRTMKIPLEISQQHLGSRSSVPLNNSIFNKIHKSWGSVDNLPTSVDASSTEMPPPNTNASVKKRQKSTTNNARCTMTTIDSPRDSISSSNSSSNIYSGYSSMPTTPNQLRAPISTVVDSLTADSDSDSACGFGSNWSVSGRSSVSNGTQPMTRFPKKL